VEIQNAVKKINVNPVWKWQHIYAVPRTHIYMQADCLSNIAWS
jgi:hypothetical protein